MGNGQRTPGVGAKEGARAIRSVHNAAVGDYFEAETTVECPWCGEPTEVTVDATGGAEQSYVEDCTVCCHPISVWVVVDEAGAQVRVSRS